MESLTENQIIHLPDLSFVQFCQEELGVNRGVYNTIDLWFYNAGVTDITKRRKKVIQFIIYIRQFNKKEKNGQIKVGAGGLTTRLNEFSERIKDNKNIVPYLRNNTISY